MENIRVMGEGFNLNYIEDQRSILGKLSVGDLHDFLPTDLLNAFSSCKSDVGRQIMEFGNFQFRFYRGRNGISAIQRTIQADKQSIPKVLRRLFPDVYIVTDYYLVDELSGKAFDVSSLWVENSSSGYSSPLVLNIPKFGNYFFPSASVLTIKRPEDDKENLEIAKYYYPSLYRDEKTVEFFSNVAPFHEAGHRQQYRDAEGINKSEENIFLHNVVLNALVYMSVFPSWGRLLIVFPAIREKLEQKKYAATVCERNAWAFTLAVLKHLRNLGVDITRDVPFKNIFKWIEWELSTYNKQFIYINGPSASNKLRALDRKHISPKEKLKRLNNP